MESTTKIMLITWESCGHCHEFLDDVWRAGLRDKLSEKYNVEHVNIPAGTTAKMAWLNTHPEVKDYIKWYPTILGWFKGAKKPEVFGAVIHGGVMSFDSHKFDFSEEHVCKWIESKSK